LTQAFAAKNNINPLYDSHSYVSVCNGPSRALACAPCLHAPGTYADMLALGDRVMLEAGPYVAHWFDNTGHNQWPRTCRRGIRVGFALAGRRGHFPEFLLPERGVFLWRLTQVSRPD
jgi:hypothetical protein